jgi:DNA repair protein RadA/Sms
LAKLKSKYVCMECGYETPKWMGKCPECNKWNTLVEEVTEKVITSGIPKSPLSKPEKIQDVTVEDDFRTNTGIGELDYS